MNDDWNGMPRFRKYPSFHAGQPTQIIRAACATVGLTTRELEVAVPHQDGELNWNDLSITAWIVLCQALHLEIDCISYGYFPDFHRRKVGHALYEGAYSLPITDRVRRIRKWYRGYQKRERARESNYYGKRRPCFQRS